MSVHISFPHLHGLRLLAEPSFTLHETSTEQKFKEDQQYIPSNALQDAVPQAQATELIDEPSMLMQFSPGEQMLVEISQ
jgi:hypothetical protein